MNRIKQLIETKEIRDETNTYKPLSTLFTNRMKYISDSAIRVYLCLLSHVNIDRALKDNLQDKSGYLPTEVNPGYRKIREETNLGFNSISAAIEELIDIGYIEVIKGGSKRTNKYTLTEDIIEDRFIARVNFHKEMVEEKKNKGAIEPVALLNE